jgi:imidazole glycerol phosphate synthase subunit HisF
MIKRLSAGLIIDSGLIVNSYCFRTHLPVGNLNHTLSRLQAFEVDDVVILNTTHTENPVDDFRELLSDLNSWHISTPLSYGGGINNVKDAAEIVKYGAERVVISADLLVNPVIFSEICKFLGDQAVVLHLPLFVEANRLCVQGKSVLTLDSILDLLPENWGGEILLTFIANDGGHTPDWDCIEIALECFGGVRGLILAGGFSKAIDIGRGLKLDQVSAIVVGNFLHRTELSIKNLKNDLSEEIQIRRIK